MRYKGYVILPYRPTWYGLIFCRPNSTESSSICFVSILKLPVILEVEDTRRNFVTSWYRSENWVGDRKLVLHATKHFI